MANILTWLDAKLFGYRRLRRGDGTDMPDRPILKITGAGVDTLADDPTNNQTVLTLAASSGAALATTKIIPGSAIDVSPDPATLASDITISVTVIDDTQHGTRGGGDLHSLASGLAAGFMSAADKTKLDGLGTSGINSITVTPPLTSDSDPSDPTLGISAATTSDPGYMSAADKTKLDGLDGTSYATKTTTITCTSPLRIDSGASADLSANRTLSFLVAANIAWNSWGITGISSLDNSGSTITVGANTTAQTIGKAGTTASFPGALSVAQTSLFTDIVTVQKDGLGTTKTVELDIINLTNSGTQVSPMLRFSAFGSGTRLNAGLQLEPQSASRALLVLYYGTGTGAPATTGTYFDNSNPNFGSAVVADAFVLRSTSTTGYRFDTSNNHGGMDLNGSNWLRLKSYNSKGFVIETGADSGGSGGVERFFIGETGLGRAVFVPSVVTSSGSNVNFDLGKSQNIRFSVNEATTLAFSNATPGMMGTLDFIQGGTPRTVTMPTNGSGVEYDATILALTLTGIVSTSNDTRTVLSYYVTDSPDTRVYIYNRSVSTMP